MRWVDALAPPPRAVDWGLFALVVLLAGTGISSLFQGTPAGAWVFWLHAVLGLAFPVVLAFKLRRVAPRLRPRRWDRATLASALLLALALAAFATGVLWTMGASIPGPYTLMVVHGVLGVLLAVPFVAHLAARFRPPRRTDVGRRTALQYAALGAASVLALRVQRGLVTALAGLDRRFTSARRAGVEPGNTFPNTVWVADDPDPVDVDEWTLSVDGAVDAPREYTAADLAPDDERRAVLDCTSGWYTDQRWRGVRVGRLLADAAVREEAAWVSFVSVTGYRWSLPVAEARDALLATHVGGERLTHGHGSPLRLVAPGRRGFQWVKWVEEVEVRTAPDYRQWYAIFTSGFE